MTPGQTSFRLPAELLRQLARTAKARGVSKSQVVREALERYLSYGSGQEPRAQLAVRERTASYIGMVRLPTADETDDPIAVRIREQNWRE